MNLDFVQIGANTGNDEDAIGEFIKNKKSCVGIFVEPNPKSFKILKNKFSDSTNHTFFVEEIAISNYNGKIILSIENYDDPNHYSQIASTVPGFTEAHPWSHQFKTTQIEVNCETLESFFYRHKIQHVKFLCIDTEGNDANIILNTDFSKLKIDTIQFEHMHTDGVHSTGKIYELTKQHLYNYGYNYISVNGGDTIMSKINTNE